MDNEATPPLYQVAAVISALCLVAGCRYGLPDYDVPLEPEPSSPTIPPCEVAEKGTGIRPCYFRPAYRILKTPHKVMLYTRTTGLLADMPTRLAFERDTVTVISLWSRTCPACIKEVKPLKFMFDSMRQDRINIKHLHWVFEDQSKYSIIRELMNIDTRWKELPSESLFFNTTEDRDKFEKHLLKVAAGIYEKKIDTLPIHLVLSREAKIVRVVLGAVLTAAHIAQLKRDLIKIVEVGEDEDGTPNRFTTEEVEEKHRMAKKGGLQVVDAQYPVRLGDLKRWGSSCASRSPDQLVISEKTALHSNVTRAQQQMLRTAGMLLGGARELGANDSKMRLWLGRYFQCRGDLKKATQAYLEALKTDPHNVDALLALSRIHEVRARAEYQKLKTLENEVASVGAKKRLEEKNKKKRRSSGGAAVNRLRAKARAQYARALNYCLKASGARPQAGTGAVEAVIAALDKCYLSFKSDHALGSVVDQDGCISGALLAKRNKTGIDLLGEDDPSAVDLR